MGFRQYQYISKVAELKNITKAANALYVSQPSLSTFITKTEEELGAQIFDRKKTPLELTPAGELFIEAGEKIFLIHECMKKQIMAISQIKIGRIKIGIAAARGPHILPLMYPAFREKHPYVELEIVEAMAQDLLELVRKRTVDFAIIPQFYEQPGLHFETICKEELFLVAKQGYLQKEDHLTHDVVDIEKAQRYPFILMRQKQAIRRVLDTYFAQNNMRLQVLMETENTITALRMAAAGEGIAIVPKITLEVCKDAENIEILRLPPDGLTWNIAAAIREDDRGDALRKELVRILKLVFQTDSK